MHIHYSQQRAILDRPSGIFNNPDDPRGLPSKRRHQKTAALEGNHAKMHVQSLNAYLERAGSKDSPD